MNTNISHVFKGQSVLIDTRAQAAAQSGQKNKNNSISSKMAVPQRSAAFFGGDPR